MRATHKSVRRVPGLVIRAHDRAVTALDGSRYPLTNRFFSIGNQIRRHVLQMERLGRTVIEWREETGRAISTARRLSG